MQVGLITGKGQVELRELPTPTVSTGRAVVDIAYCGICGTDVHAFLSGDPYNPAICGHEWVGRVSAVAGDVRTAKEGDRVGIGVATACGHCHSCELGNATHCELVLAGMVGIGPMAATHGGFAAQIAIDGSRIYPVQSHLSDLEAALLEPTTIALHAVRRTPVQLGDLVVVIGGGPIGLLTLQCARAAGAGRLLLIEPQPARRALAQTLGANEVIDPRQQDVAAQIMEATQGRGADIVFECAGVAATVQQAVTLVRRGGVVSLVGLPTFPAEIRVADWLMKEVRAIASLGYQRHEFLLAQALVADGRINLGALHSQTVPLSGLANALSRLASSPQDVKILVDPRIH